MSACQRRRRRQISNVENINGVFSVLKAVMADMLSIINQQPVIISIPHPIMKK
jgi:hypothetical protein